MSKSTRIYNLCKKIEETKASLQQLENFLCSEEGIAEITFSTFNPIDKHIDRRVAFLNDVACEEICRLAIAPIRQRLSEMDKELEELTGAPKKRWWQI